MARFKILSSMAIAAGLSLLCPSLSFGQSNFGLRYNTRTTIRDYRNFTGSTSGYSLGGVAGGYQLRGGSMNPSSDIIRANIGGFSSGNRSGGSSLNFAGPRFGISSQGSTLGSRGLGNPNYGVNSARLGGNFDAGGNAGAMDLNNVIPLSLSAGGIDPFAPSRSAPSTDDEFLKPYVEKKFLRPTPGTVSAKPPADAPKPGVVAINSDQKLGGTTQMGAFAVARQMAQARDSMRQQRYEQALTCYQTAQTVDSKDLNSQIGAIYCHLMRGKFQVAGLNVHRLLSQYPSFWRESADFDAVFGMSRDEIVRQVSDLIAKVNEFCSRYNTEDSKQVAEDFKWVYLSVVYMAWLTGDTEIMRENATLAAKVAPLDETVQKFFFQVTGEKEKVQPLKLQPIEPIN